MTGPNTAVMPFSDLSPDIVVTAVTDDGPVLVGARCTACGSSWFPARPVCPSCAAEHPEPLHLGPRGTIYSYTTVEVSSARETPYVLAFIDLEQGVRVLSTIRSGGEIAIDAACRLVVDDDGSWCFTVEES